MFRPKQKLEVHVEKRDSFCAHCPAEDTVRKQESSYAHCPVTCLSLKSPLKDEIVSVLIALLIPKQIPY